MNRPLPVNYAKLFIGEMGRTIANVYEDGLLVDKVVGYTQRDCLESLAIQYPGLRVIDADGHSAHTPRTLLLSSRGIVASSVIDQTIHEIMGEISDMRINGTLRPFVEGEPIGVIPPAHRADLKRRKK